MTLRCCFVSVSLVATALAQPLLPGAAQPAPAAEAPVSSESVRLQYANGIVAVAEDKIITVADVMNRVAPLLAQLKNEARSEKEYYEGLERYQDTVIQDLIDEVLIIKEFRKDEKRHIPASYVDNAIDDDLAERFEGNRSKFLAYLKAQGKTKLEYRREKEEEIILNYMQGQQRRSASLVSPVRIETYYNENKDQFYREDGVHLRIIQLNRNEENTDTVIQQKINLITTRLKAGDKFEDLAKEYSDTNKAKGGDWDWMQRSSLKPEFSEPAFKLKKGEVSEPVVQPEATYLLYAEDRRYAGIQPLDEVRDLIERRLIAQMSRSNQERWLERLRRNGYIKHY